MKVYCYYEDIGWPDEGAVVDLWEKAWRKNGFEPVVLNESHARDHPYYYDIEDSAWLKNTVNSWPYIRCCYLRWLAYSNIESGLPVFVCDYDVIPYDFHPEDLPAVLDYKAHCLDRWQIPCAFIASVHNYQSFSRCLRNAAVLKAWGRRCVMDDISEMNLLFDFCRPLIQRHDLIRMHGIDPDWRKAKLVHYSNNGTPKPRHEAIMTERNPL